MSLLDALFAGPTGSTFDGQLLAGFSCGFDTIIGVTLLGDGKCQQESDPGWLELAIMAVSLGAYDPWELNAGQNLSTFVSSRDWYLLRFILVVLGLIIIPELLIIIINLL